MFGTKPVSLLGAKRSALRSQHMSKSLFHPSLECVQHGGKSLDEVLAYAKRIGCVGVQLSNFHLLNADGEFIKADAVKSALEQYELRLDGISAHCLFWVHGAAGTGTPSVSKFVPADIYTKGNAGVETWAEIKCIELMELSNDLENFVIPMFWGPYQGLEVVSGYPWGMWDLPVGNLVQQGFERFAEKTGKLRGHAGDCGLSLAHELHRGTAATCAEDFLKLVNVCDGDGCLDVNADPSHCWDGEDVETRFTKVGKHVIGCHVKDMQRIPGRSMLSMEDDWKKRGMQFTKLGEGELNLHRYVQLMIDVGYPQRFRELQGLEKDATVPLVGEAESAYYDLDEVSEHATNFIAQNLCSAFATQSFEKDMGK